MRDPSRNDLKEIGALGADGPAPAIIALCAILLGTAVRLAMYFQNPSLWFDEIGVAISVAMGSRFDVQTAPPLYLAVERLFALLGGVNDLTLRLPSLLAGLLVLVLIAAIGFRMGGPWVGALAAAMAALSSNLCRYSNELKPYGIDATVSAALLLLALPVLNGGNSRMQRLLLFVAGFAAVLLSTPAIFVLAGVAAALFLRDLKRGSKPSQFLGLGAASLVWAVTFLMVYRVSYGSLADSEFMRRFWAGALVTPSSGFLKIITSIADALALPALGLEDPSIVIRIVCVVLLLPGIRAVFRRFGLPGVTLFCAPLACAVAAALMGKWYLTTRLMMFGVPAICVLMAMGAWQLSAWAPKSLQLRAFWIVSALALILPLRYTLWRVRHPEKEGNRGLVAAAIHEARPGDVFYVYPRSTAAWAYYSIDWRNNDRSDARRLVAAIIRSGPNSANVPSRGAPVVHEGFDWRFERAGRIELFGVPTGIESTTFGNAGVPDPGWADNEIDRMLNERTATRFWIVCSEYQPPALDSLINRLKEGGFSVEPAYQGLAVALYRALPPRA